MNEKRKNRISGKPTIEICSTASPEPDAWEKARDVVADCFLHLLKGKICDPVGTVKREVDNGVD